VCVCVCESVPIHSRSIQNRNQTQSLEKKRKKSSYLRGKNWYGWLDATILDEDSAFVQQKDGILQNYQKKIC